MMTVATMDIIKAIAYCFILHTIGELDESTGEELMERLKRERLTDGKREIEDEMVIFAKEQSVPLHAVEWIKKSWTESSVKNPKEFADEVLDVFMTTLD